MPAYLIKFGALALDKDDGNVDVIRTDMIRKGNGFGKNIECFLLTESRV